MGEFDIALEDIFKNGKVIQEVCPRLGAALLCPLR